MFLPLPPFLQLHTVSTMYMCCAIPLADLPNANALKQAKYQIEILPWPRVSSIATLFAHSLRPCAFDASAFKVHNCTIFLCSLDVGK